ncbi:DUF2849 domain-containing protein [Pseudochelatococcus contaminans]|uniref:DUF2849 domain-containing protein n=1 Tax=Pseudochelatococcus contaminans TaxID=1538103 RepID=A0A7W5Z6Z7_9HYPH|nr:DUF2849 domain-containing protein [Pseudochelatococcus contaminans]MBB3810842.1 hypothetical protein [Pseudochelatococcus contaminans]
MKRDAKAAIPQVLTANDLHSGLVVFRTPAGEWSTHINAAEVVDTPEAAAVLTEAGAEDERRNLVVGAYLVNVKREEDAIVPLVLREAIRAAGGPTAGTSVALAHAPSVS